MRARPSLLLAISAGMLALTPIGVAAATAASGSSSSANAHRTSSPVTSLVSRTRPYPAYLAIDLRGIEAVFPAPTTTTVPRPVARPVVKQVTPVASLQIAQVEVASGFIWPVHGPVISPFGARDGRRHEGADIGSPIGTPVHAPIAGRVALVGTMSGYGLVIDVDHGDGMTTRYAHLSRQDVHVGQEVAQGDVLGAVGMTGRTTAPHLHFEVRIGGVPHDPLAYLP